MRADDDVGFYLCLGQYRGVHADEHVVAYYAGVHRGAMADDDVAADGHIAASMNNAVILHVAVAADAYLAEVGTDDSAWPDGAFFAYLNIADDVRELAYACRIGYFRRFAIE